MIVWGARDAIIPVEHARAAHREMPGSRLEILEGVGHFPHAEVPDRFVGLIDDFMRSTRASHVSAATWRRLLDEQQDRPRRKRPTAEKPATTPGAARAKPARTAPKTKQAVG